MKLTSSLQGVRARKHWKERRGQQREKGSSSGRQQGGRASGIMQEGFDCLRLEGARSQCHVPGARASRVHRYKGGISHS